MSPDRPKVSARDLLSSSERLRADLLTAVAKLDSYIEQLRAVAPPTTEGHVHEHPPTG